MTDEKSKGKGKPLKRDSEKSDFQKRGGQEVAPAAQPPIKVQGDPDQGGGTPKKDDSGNN